ncbi:hypothetical protein JCM16418_5152 [Paenibacillus pini JCM 16418]|uniref:IrrE N-terminal-like domain-containing protein n=2 Tax=Paenibacillus TaxID=44249 RepID=W7YJ29_9BACL|nr:hypothetical protein JCM16418_5152 [Paenibacillus pini JCM 16418]
MCIAFHELGHYIDFKENPELFEKFDCDLYQEKKYEFEYRAYQLGRKLIVDRRLLEIYDELNKERLNGIKMK